MLGICWLVSFDAAEVVVKIMNKKGRDWESLLRLSAHRLGDFPDRKDYFFMAKLQRFSRCAEEETVLHPHIIHILFSLLLPTTITGDTHH